MVREIKDISYLNPENGSPEIDDKRTMDIYLPEDVHNTSADVILVVFIHGGAWRAGDKDMHSLLAKQWASLSAPASINAEASSKAANVVVAVPNYRLSPAVKHPVHTDDIYDALKFLLSPHPHPDIPNFTYSQIWVAGHSAGAHIASSLVLCAPEPTAQTSQLSHPDSDLDDVRHRITGIIGLEGIYDIDMLLKSFPSLFYRTFIEQAFEARPSYEGADITHYTLPLAPTNGGDDTKKISGRADHLRWVIVHSREDTLVDLAQAQAVANHLRELYHPVEGRKETNNNPPRVFEEYDRIVGEHDDLLDSVALADFVGDVIFGTL
ncbi:alpha/beta-hydrolase [Clavulina sp. PMI_390]|nr:alpha/beta-hydrolase [Clavulina sp. PMI_390]